MSIIQRSKAIVHSLRQLSVQHWGRCPDCRSTVTCKWGSYARRPWFFEGRKRVRVIRTPGARPPRYPQQACQGDRHLFLPRDPTPPIQALR